MMWVAIVHLASLAIVLELADRAPVLPFDGRR